MKEQIIKILKEAKNNPELREVVEEIEEDLKDILEEMPEWHKIGK